MQYEQKSTAKSKPKIAFRDDEDEEDEQDDDEDDIEEDESEDEEDADLVSTTQGGASDPRRVTQVNSWCCNQAARNWRFR